MLRLELQGQCWHEKEQKMRARHAGAVWGGGAVGWVGAQRYWARVGLGMEIWRHWKGTWRGDTRGKAGALADVTSQH